MHQQDRIIQLEDTLTAKVGIRQQIHLAEEALDAEKDKLIMMGPCKIEHWISYENECVRPGIDYSRKNIR